MTLDEKAHLVATDMVNTGNISNTVGFDPSIILVIIGIITQVMQMFQNCNKPAAQAAATAKSPGLIERFLLRRIIRSAINDAEMEQYLANGLFKSLIKVGAKQKVEDFQAMFAAV